MQLLYRCMPQAENVFKSPWESTQFAFLNFDDHFFKLYNVLSFQVVLRGIKTFIGTEERFDSGAL